MADSEDLRSTFLTDCNADSLPSHHSVSLPIDTVTANVAGVVDNEHAIQSRSDSPEVCNLQQRDETGNAESELHSTDSLVVVPDNEYQTDSNSDSFEVVGDDESPMNNTKSQSEGVHEGKGYVMPSPVGAAAVHSKPIQSDLAAVHNPENQSHEKKTRDEKVVSFAENQKLVSAKGSYYERCAGTVSTEKSNPNNLETPALDGSVNTSNEESLSQEPEMLAQALRGVYKNGSITELCDVVLQSPTGIHRCPPLIEQSTAMIWCQSREQAEAFTYYFTHMGLGLELSRSLAGLEQDGIEKDLKTSFLQHSTHTIVPTHRWILDKKSLRFSDTLLTVLKQLEVFTMNFNDEEQIQASCNLIFQKYGSHVHVGNIHFGGIYSWEAQYSGEERDVGTVKQMLADTLAAYSATVSTNAHPLEVISSVSSIGGNSNVCSFEDWKCHIEKDHAQVTCIDRGKTVVGLWEIILNHRDDLRDAEAMSARLQAAWQQENGDLPSIDPHRVSENVPINDPQQPQTSLDLIRYLHLEKFYPEKISMRDVMQVGDGVVKTEGDIADVPWTILQKLIMLDRKCVISEIKRCARAANSSIEDDTSSSDSSTDLSELGVQEEQLNPADVFLAIFLCCDLNLRQILVEKMNQCHLAFPFLFPDQHKQNLNLSLWALRNTKLAWRNVSQEVIEASAVNYPLKMVSCLRLGQPEISKSKLLNKVIDDEGDTFLSESSPNGDIPRTCSNGSVEGSFYLPSGKKTQILEDVSLFLNLRGDGLQHQKQVRILGKMSTVMLVFLDVSDLQREDIRSELTQIHQDCKEVIIVLSNRTKGLSKAMVDSLLKRLKQTTGKSISKVLAFTLEGRKNEDKLKNDLRQKLLKGLSQQAGITLQDQQNLIFESDVVVDEMNKHCQEGKACAKRVISYLGGNNDRASKSELLPLQGVYWKEWCKLMKKKKRSGQQAGIQKAGEMETEMQDHRKNQDWCCHDLSPIMQAFINGLEATIDSPSIHFYMQWLKMSFDDLSRRKLHPLLAEYQTRLQGIKEAKDKKESELVRLQKELVSLEESIDNATFGLEHLLREIGQIFEAAVETKNEYHSKQFCNLPMLATKLLLKGHSLEIMDGNASGVPMTWLRAVFRELEKELTDKKLFSLSVLGVQSSGKSTLLNTMFGLQFPVSAGRCTTGVYLQLLRVKDGSNLPFSYLAVFDTEGLRSQDKIESNYNHDNELATFVIGLGNLTLMNIKGENVSDAKDILQIATHAFLRMKMVNERIQRDRSCVFVHQNVPAFDAKEKLQIGSQKFEEALDKMTVEAATLENIGEIKCFNQVIGFDTQKHIWYFPDLWHGEPPMASVNTGYHEKTMELKTDLLHHHAMKKQYLCNTLEMIDVIADMWNGVLADDFVFGFRNSLVTKAYNSLEEKYSQLKWNLDTAYRDQKNRSQTEVKRCQTHEALQELCTQLKKKTLLMIHEKGQSTLKELTSFIDGHGQKEIMFSWRKQKCYALQFAAEMLCLQAQNDISQMRATQGVNMLRNLEQDRHKREIFIKAEKLGEKMKNIEDYRTLDTEFNNMWREWIRSIANHQSMGDKNVDIEDTLVDLLYEHYPGHSSIISHELGIQSLAEFCEYDQLVGSLTVDDISKSDLSLTWSKSFWTKVSSSEKLKLKAQTVSIINNIFKKIDSHLKKVSQSSSGFQKHDAEELLRLLSVGILDYNFDSYQAFKIPKNYEIWLAIHVLTHSNKVFTEAQAYFNKNHSIAAQLEEYKETTRKMFLHHVGKKSDIEGIAVDMVCDQLQPLIKQHIQEGLENAIVKEVVPQFYTKKKLIEEILSDLAEKDSREDYNGYIVETKTFVLEWLVKYTDKRIFSKDQPSCWYGEKAKALVEHLIKNIQQSVLNLPTGQKTIDAWIESLSQSLHESHISIPFMKREVPYISDYEVKSFENIQKAFDKKLNILSKELCNYFDKECSENVRWIEKTPYELILNALWGCEAVCPFCNEPCSKSDQKHSSPADCHECVQHRPQGVASWSWTRSKKLVFENCNYNVQADIAFRCAGTSHICDVKETDKMRTYHPYRNYKTYLPDWHIQPSPDMESTDYWKWYLCKYKNQIAQDAGLQEPDVPPSWNSITMEKALQSFDGFKGRSPQSQPQISLLDKIRKLFGRQ